MLYIKHPQDLKVFNATELLTEKSIREHGTRDSFEQHEVVKIDWVLYLT